MGRDTIIENPVINSAFAEPARHFRFDHDGITNEIAESRRVSAYFVPIAQPKKKGKKDSDQLTFDTEWTLDRIQENDFINQVRAKVSAWRRSRHLGVTPMTRRLLEYWTAPDRDRKLFFCQIEAAETAIYLTECAPQFGDAWMENAIRDANAEANPGLYRLALKMATGSGKTVVMGMLIAWQALNKIANPQDARFSDSFLIVSPGITIRDRLRVLLPSDPGNYYLQRDILPPDPMEILGQARVIITNYHTFLRRERVAAGRLTKSILGGGKEGAFTETADQMVRRVCRELGGKKNVVVINDEAHHCYRHKIDAEDDARLTGDDRTEAEKREEAARVWISGLEAVRDKIGIRTVYDLSATPFFLRGSGYPEGTLFPWVVSDFSLIDAIESGIVKVPRVPVEDDSMTGGQPTYRDLWLRIREHLPKKGRGTAAVGGEPKLPAELQGALHSLYGNYEKAYLKWEQNVEARARGMTPPVFIVVCNNTNVSKLVFDYIAGWEKPLSEDRTVLVPGALSVFSNVVDGAWTARPNTILIDSEQLESGEAMSADFKSIAAHEIDEFKAEYRQRFPGRDPDQLTDEDLLREVMNTVGKPGRLGENVRCVVSVSMLTEGWDANTVTHILGVRAFGTQLLCEQVVGRGLRRMSYEPNPAGMFEPEYAEVYGVPFSFIPCGGTIVDPPPPKPVTRVRALEDRIACEITFPRVAGYRYELADRTLTTRFTADSRLALSTKEVPSKTLTLPIVGEASVHTLDELKARRPREIAFLLAKLTLEKYFRQDGETRDARTKKHAFDSEVQVWLFPQVLDIARRWLAECVTCKDNAFPQMLLLLEFAHDASDRIYQSIVAADGGEKSLAPILQPYDAVGSTRYVGFDTTRPTYPTDARFCHVSHVVCDTESWEQKMAQALEELGAEGRLLTYVKNHGLGFAIPYTINGEQHQYIPDFIARLDDGHGRDDPLNLIVEVTGEKDKDKAAKVATARTLWIPAVNNHGAFGRWAFVEIDDPWGAKGVIQSLVAGGRT